MIHIADHRPDPTWSTRLCMWGNRAHRYLASPLTFAVAGVGGAAGLILSILAGTALTWAVVATVAALTVFGVLLGRGKIRSIRPHQWGVLLLGVFFNQVFLVAPAMYFIVAIAVVVAALPPILHGLGVAVLRPLAGNRVTAKETPPMTTNTTHVGAACGARLSWPMTRGRGRVFMLAYAALLFGGAILAGLVTVAATSEASLLQVPLMTRLTNVPGQYN